MDLCTLCLFGLTTTAIKWLGLDLSQARRLRVNKNRKDSTRSDSQCGLESEWSQHSSFECELVSSILKISFTVSLFFHSHGNIIDLLITNSSSHFSFVPALKRFLPGGVFLLTSSEPSSLFSPLFFIFQVFFQVFKEF